MTPVEFAIADGGQELLLVLPEGRMLAIDAWRLWVSCPSALARRRRMAGLDLNAPACVRVTRCEPVGRYALNIAFSDGRDRGVFPWPLLLQLATLPTTSAFLAPPEPVSVAQQPGAELISGSTP